MLRWLKTVVVSDEEKAPVEASGGDREGERERIVADVPNPVMVGPNGAVVARRMRCRHNRPSRWPRAISGRGRGTREIAALRSTTTRRSDDVRPEWAVQRDMIAAGP